ncbi:hypothetical protein RSAG8_09822, partial [Rhizoctonia solani AG-8 WAC10335]
MASPTESLSAPCTLNYNDDEQLLQVDIPAVLLPEAPGGTRSLLIIMAQASVEQSTRSRPPYSIIAWMILVSPILWRINSAPAQVLRLSLLVA